jgi:hypothetical protein
MTNEQREALAQARKLLIDAGMRLESNGAGFQIMHGNQALAQAAAATLRCRSTKWSRSRTGR